MAKSEIPSIVVHSGGGSNGCGSDMEQHQSSRPSRLSKQEEFEVEEEGCVPSPVMIQIEDGGGGQDEPFDEGGGEENGCRFDAGDDTLSSDGDGPTRTNVHSPSARQSPEQPDEKTDKNKTGARSSSQRVKLLVRSQAVHDDTSPPPDLEAIATNTNMLSVTNAPSFTTQSQAKSSSNKNRLGRQGSSQGSTESSSGLSRDSSTETYTDSTGIDLQQFIIDTLHKNQKDRLMLLKIEQELITLVKDNKRQSQKFPQMSSYNRMLVHRVAAFFGLDHYVDQSGTAVIVNKTKNTRIPDSRFQDHIRDELLPEEPKKSILKRDSASFEEGKEKSPERQSSTDSRRSKSFEEREEEYEKARARIFNQDEGLGESPLSRSQEGTHSSSRRSSQEDLRWASDTRPWSSTDSDSSGRPHGTKSGSSFETESVSQGGGKSGRAIAVLTKADSDNKELLLPTRTARPAVTKASSFGGISVLTRDTSSGKSTTPRITKAESFNITTISSSHLSPTNIGNSIQPHTATSTSPSPTHLSTSSLQPTSSSQFPAVTGTSQQTFPMVAGQPTQLQLPVQQVSSQQLPSGWQPANRDTTLSTDYGSHSTVGQPLVWPLSAATDALLPGSVIINPQTGTPYLNVESTVYRYKPATNTSGQTIMLAPFQPVAVPAPNQVPIASHLPAGSAISPTQQQPQHQQQPQSPPQLQVQQQPQQTMQAAPTVVYIPYVPSQVQTPVTPQQSLAQIQTSQQQQQQQQQTQLLNDQRPFTLDTGGASIGDIVAQMSGLSFVPTHLSTQQPQDATAGRGVMGVDTSTAPQSYIIPTFKSQGFISQQGNVAQFPVYYMQQVPQASNVHPVRYVFPASSPAQQTAQGASSNVGIGGQGVADLQSHVATQATSQVAGPQYLPGYPVLALSQSGDTAVPSSFINYSIATQTSAVTTTTSVLVPSSGMSVPVYPYTNMVISNVSNGTQAYTSPATSQPTQPTAYVPSPVAMQTPAAVPMYVVTTTSTQTPVTQTHVASNVAAQFASFRSQSLPPSQSGTSPAAVNHQLGVGSPFVGYTVYTPPLQSTATQQPPTPTALNQSTHTPSSSSQFAPAFMTTFQVLRPSIPVVGNIRTSTPPPQNVMPPQFPTPPPSSKVPLSFPLVKQASDPGAGDCFGIGAVGSGRTDQQKGSRTTQLQVGTPTMCGPTSSLMCRRGIPVMQDLCLIGHPLQHHLNPLMLPQQRPLARFPHPSGSGSSASNRPPKMRKQRNKGSGSSNNNSGARSSGTAASSQPLSDIGGNHILEIEGLPEGMKRSEVERYLEQVTSHGAKIQFLSTENGGIPGNGSDFVVSARHLVLAVFESETAAQSALLSIKTPKFQLRQLRRGGKDGSLKNLS